MKNLLLSLCLLISINVFPQSIILELHAIIPPDSNYRLQDGCRVDYSPNFSDGYSFQDALKFGNINETFAIESNGKLLAHERRASYATLPLYMWQMRNLQYRFKIVKIAIDTAYFEDTKSGRAIPLENITYYEFVTDCISDTCEIKNRFRIVYRLNTLSIAPDPVRQIPVTQVKATLYPNPCNGTVTVNAPAGSIVTFIGNNQVKRFKPGLIETRLPNGVYHVVIENDRGGRVTRLLEIRR